MAALLLSRKPPQRLADGFYPTINCNKKTTNDKATWIVFRIFRTVKQKIAFFLEEERLDYSKYREYSSRFVLCCFFVTVNWSLLKRQDLDTVIIIKFLFYNQCCHIIGALNQRLWHNNRLIHGESAMERQKEDTAAKNALHHKSLGCSSLRQKILPATSKIEHSLVQCALRRTDSHWKACAV